MTDCCYRRSLWQTVAIGFNAPPLAAAAAYDDDGDDEDDNNYDDDDNENYYDCNKHSEDHDD